MYKNNISSFLWPLKLFPSIDKERESLANDRAGGDAAEIAQSRSPRESTARTVRNAVQASLYLAGLGTWALLALYLATSKTNVVLHYVK
jgi:hypothetical protein